MSLGKKGAELCPTAPAETRRSDGADDYDIVVIGGGSAGLAAAIAAVESARCSVLVVEREDYLGGVLPQCVHDGFGLHCFGESLTGPEYARRWIGRARASSVPVALSTTVLGLAYDGSDADAPWRVDVLGPSVGGRRTLRARAVVCAAGCRERTRGALRIPGTRPAGVLTAGSAQYMVNVANQSPGDKAVILGSGDIGLIMARRLTLEGAEVRLVLGQEATGLVRNHIRCIEDFGIPFRTGWGVASVHGVSQLTGVTVAPLREDGSFDLSRREYVRCNVLLTACGLIPEREVLAGLGALGEGEGLFVCGNARVPHDLVDQVSQEGVTAGLAAARFAAACADAPEPVLPDDLRALADRAIVEPKGRMADAAAPLAAGWQRVVCTVCPAGCVMEAGPEGAVAGNGCLRGAAYAQEERACPRRLFTGTVRLEGAPGRRLLPVRTDGEVPRTALAAVAAACRRLRASAPVAVGQVIVSDVAGTGVALVAADSAGEGGPWQ